MSNADLRRLVPGAASALYDILSASRGSVEPPIRSEIFGPQRFAQHGRSLGETHRASRATRSAATFFPRLRSNIVGLREAHRYIGMQAATGYDISPAAEWLLDNFHLIEAQLKEIHEGLPKSYFRSLPVLIDEPLAGLPRVYGVAWAFVAHTDGAFDDDLLVQFLSAYQDTRELNLSEMWALPTTLRVVLIENLRRLAERVATNKAAREVANLCCDHIETYSVQALDELLATLNRRGVGRVFSTQMAQRLRDRRTSGESAEYAVYQDWVRSALPDLAAAQTQQNADQAADNLSVSNAVTSLRAIGDADWPDIIARTSQLMRLMLTSAMFEAEDAGTRDQTLHGIERLARQNDRSELAVAQLLLDKMREAAAINSGNDATAVAGYWLFGAGTDALTRALGFQQPRLLSSRRLHDLFALPAYLSSLLVGSLALVAWAVLHRYGLTDTDASLWVVALAAVLMMFPASEAVVAVINRLISESLRPKHLPRLGFVNGIPSDHRVIVVIPGMLTSSQSTRELVHQLQLHYLANAEQNAQFALLTDWADADEARIANDDVLLSDARAQIREINALYSALEGDAARFILLHRERSFATTEQRWIGWERKRGKLEQLVATLATGTQNAFIDLGDESRLAINTKYVVTLDSDTQLPPGRLRELVGVAAHPQNQPRLDALGSAVTSGYGILQPRVVTPLPAPKNLTLYHWLFAGQCGIDPYSAATSEVYQDLFSEGSFTGKGLLNVRAVHAVLNGRLPDGQILSHDLLEGSLVRCAAVTDITVIEDAPFHADVAASRVHRWTRGDWQLLPLLVRPNRYPMRAINRWKMYDNLRRSLVAPMSLALLLLALVDSIISPWAAIGMVIAAFSAGPLMGALAAFAPSRDDIAKRHFYWHAGTELARTLWGGLWQLSQLLAQALMSVDAIVRALYRMAISHRHLLQWTTAAAAQAQAKTELKAVLRQHWSLPLVAMGLVAALLALGTPYPELTITMGVMWATSPISIWWVSRARAARDASALPIKDQQYLEGVARDTWRIFERCVTADDNFLPPDNFQTLPHDMLAHRTSPTNIGLYLLSVVCAREFGWIGTQELLRRLRETMATLAQLERHRGHFLNWYDTQSRAPLLPMYVSTVDSGNLSGHLLSVAQACLELAHAPFSDAASRRAICASKLRLAPLLAHWPELFPSLLGDSAIARLLALSDPIAESRARSAWFEHLLNEAEVEIAEPTARQPDLALPAHATRRDMLIWLLTDHINTCRSSCLDGLAVGASTINSPERVASANTASIALRSIARDCEALAWQADFDFLYHRRRHLFHIGYRVSDQQLDASFYDLLASESRLTSLLAVAKGDVPVRHWGALGRLFYAVGTVAGLRSWSGSMFEYLMPNLVLKEPAGSVLLDAGRAALHEQIAFAAARNVPWGISESAYAGRDYTLAYQYAPQGVPRLALRRTPTDELVIAPYATALAAQLAPRRACANFAALEKLAARGRYGFIEALDFSPSRQAGNEAFTPVSTFMAHHQGMTIVALTNVLLQGAAQRWGMANAHIEAVSSLLHERAPREVSVLYAPPSGLPPQAMQQRPPGLLREVVPGRLALEPTHVLSNGRYSVTVRANGAGWSNWRSTGITRRRDDALRDAYGSFFYLRWPSDPSDSPLASRESPVSITQHPAPDPDATYKATYHADRVCFDAVWSDLQAHATVWVSPEDDIEFRVVELRNLTHRTVEIELLSSFEITLADPRADEAHPAFSNFFVTSEWLPDHQALLFERKLRLATEKGLMAAHFLTQSDAQVVDVRVQTDRQQWLGRNRDRSVPLASFDSVATGALDTGLDPVCAISVRLRIAPNAKAELTFATAASDNSGTLHAVIDKYRQASHVQRASLMSATLAGIRLRAMHINAENHAAFQAMTTALVFTVTRPRARATPRVANDNSPAEVCDRRLLWRLGISGDRPIILVTVGTPEGLGLLRAMARALRLWSWGGIACDMVVLNAEPTSYQMGMVHEIAGLRERHESESALQGGAAATGFHSLRPDDISADELSTLQRLARIRFHGDGRPLVHHVQEWIELHEQALVERRKMSLASPATWVAPAPSAANTATVGEFVEPSGEFRFNVSATSRPARPWVNVLANTMFATQLTEAGGGYTSAVNSRLNQLTAWSNDPIADPSSEWFLLQDRKSMEVWNVCPSSVGGDPTVVYRVVHGQGYSLISHRRGDLDVTASWCVDTETSVKQVRLRLINRGHRALHLRVIGIAEWIMGANRVDRGTVRTGVFRQALPSAQSPGQSLNALLCTQRDRTAGFGDGTAFLATVGVSSTIEEAPSWTCDRRECFDARGRLVIPDRFNENAGSGFDPCAALSTRVVIDAGETLERVFLLGYADTPDAARTLAAAAALTPAIERMETVRTHWDQLLGATTVKTPDPLFDTMVNRWLMYQTVSCRLWAKAGFYQAGGATGFRDQLQDTMALAWAAPAMLRDQIVLCASRQFAEGDVQHWWHAPLGAGVRTHFSDDLLWLAHACLHYVNVTGDVSLLEQAVPFIDGMAIPDGAEDAYYTPTVSSVEATVYEHAARAIDRSLRVGVHGLPLMGSGDWNDGMNRVGIEGRGESVWLGWFLCKLVAGFAPLARDRGDAERAQRWESAALGWRTALDGQAWDGQWFKRAFFDDGQALGSHANPEAKIDLIAQAWAVLSNSASPDKQRVGLEAIEGHLIDHDAGLVKLLDPPLVNASPSAGYIQAYPPGVRENGGQYSHGAVWALMAQAEYAKAHPNEGDHADLAYRYFAYLSPAHRAVQPTSGGAYGIEPYVMAGDVYTQPPYVGRGGWSWYTGAAAWMHRAAIEAIFGLQLGADSLSFSPCLPSHWQQAELTLKRDQRSLRFILMRGSDADVQAATARWAASRLHQGESLNWKSMVGEHCYVVPLGV